MKYKVIFFLVSIYCLFACKDLIIMDSIKSEKILVVNGFISNEPGPYTINLSYSAPVELPEFLKCTGAKVSIVDNNGYTEELTEIDPGVYETSALGIQGIVGDEYKLIVNTPDGKSYETDFQKLLGPVGIDTVYAVLDSALDLNFPLGVLPGYQFYVSTKEANEPDNYFLWTMTECYEYDVDWEFGYIDTGMGDDLYYYPRIDTLSTCYMDLGVNYIFTGSTAKLDIAKIIDQPLIFIGTDSKKITKRYSLLVKQYTISKLAYTYWQEIEAQTSNENFLTTSQPINIVSNLKNIDNDDEMVFGYFSAMSVSESRIFVNRPNVDFYYPKAVLLWDEDVADEWRRNHPPPYYYAEVEEQVYILSQRVNIFDCRNEGGVLEKPDFWIDIENEKENEK